MEDSIFLNIFKAILIFTAFQRIGELFWAKRNEKIILSQGGMVIKEGRYILMVLFHTIWILSLLYLAFFSYLEFNPLLFYFGGGLFLLGQCFRLSAIFTLKERWSTRIVILPNVDVVRSGIYRFLKHPNYWGVAIEVLALPLMANSLELAVLFSLINGMILYFRIKLEEEMLGKYNHLYEAPAK